MRRRDDTLDPGLAAELDELEALFADDVRATAARPDPDVPRPARRPRGGRVPAREARVAGAGALVARGRDGSRRARRRRGGAEHARRRREAPRAESGSSAPRRAAPAPRPTRLARPARAGRAQRDAHAPDARQRRAGHRRRGRPRDPGRRRLRARLADRRRRERRRRLRAAHPQPRLDDTLARSAGSPTSGLQQSTQDITARYASAARLQDARAERHALLRALARDDHQRDRRDPRPPARQPLGAVARRARGPGRPRPRTLATVSVDVVGGAGARRRGGRPGRRATRCTTPSACSRSAPASASSRWRWPAARRPGRARPPRAAHRAPPAAGDGTRRGVTYPGAARRPGRERRAARPRARVRDARARATSSASPRSPSRARSRRSTSSSARATTATRATSSRSGHARAIREHADGRTITLAHFGPGDIFGELAMFDDEKRSATVETLDDGRGGRDPRRRTCAACSASTPTSRSSSSSRSGGACARPTSGSPASPSRRCRAAWPTCSGSSCDQAQSEGAGERDVLVTITQADIAQLAGSSRESASRFLAVLERAGVVPRAAAA